MTPKPRRSLGGRIKALKRAFRLPQDRRLAAARTTEDLPAAKEARRLVMRALHAKLIGRLRIGVTAQAATLRLFSQNPGLTEAELVPQVKQALSKEGKLLSHPQEQAVAKLSTRLRENYTHLLALDVQGNNAYRFMDTMMAHWVRQGTIDPRQLAGQAINVDLSVAPFALVVRFPTEQYFRLFERITVTERGESFRFSVGHGRMFSPQINGRRVPVIVVPDQVRDLTVAHQFIDADRAEAQRVITIRINPEEILRHELEHAKTDAVGIRLANNRRFELPTTKPRLHPRARVLYQGNVSRALKHELTARLKDARSIAQAIAGVNEAIELEFTAHAKNNALFLSQAEIDQIHALPRLLQTVLQLEKPYEIIELMRDPAMDIWRVTRRLRSLANTR